VTVTVGIDTSGCCGVSVVGAGAGTGVGAGGSAVVCERAALARQQAIASAELLKKTQRL
jgi:hypothetical protein